MSEIVGHEPGRHSRAPMRRGRAAVVSLFAGLTAGCGGFTDQARHRLVEANTAYEHGDLHTAEAKLDAVLKECPSAPESAEAYYIRGLCHQRALHHAAAESDMRRCIGLSKRPDLTARAHACLGQLCSEAGNYVEAIEHYATATPVLADETGADTVRLRYGTCLQRVGKWEEARQQFSYVMHRFPSSPCMEEARRRFSWPAGAFSIQCGAFQQAAQAAAVVQSLRSAKLDARRTVESRPGQPLHMVYVGRYVSYAQAQAALPGVRKFVPDALIVP